MQPPASSTPASAIWRRLLMTLVALTFIPLVVMAINLSPELTRRSLVLHASVAAMIVPLTLVAMLNAASRGSTLCLQAMLALGAVVLTAMIALDAGKPLLVSYFPMLNHGAYPATLLALTVATGLLLLIRPGRRQQTPDHVAGVAWVVLPLFIAVVSIIWSWTATADTPSHIRAELVTWGGGHAWGFFLTSLSLWSWLIMTDISAAERRYWSAAAALTAVGVLIIQATTPIDSARYLNALTRFQLATIWIVPATLTFKLMRDPIRRAVGGRYLVASMVCFFIPLAIAAWFILIDGSGNAQRLGPLILQHGFGFAAATGLWGAIQHRKNDTATTLQAIRQKNDASFLLPTLVVGSVATLILLLSLNMQNGFTPKTAPVDPATRQHAVDRRQAEIAERFQQGVQMMQLRQYGYAITAFHRVLELDPTLPEAHVNIGFALYETKDYPGAQRFFESASRLNKNQLNAYYGLALTARAQGANDVAAGAMRTWLHLAPADDPFRQKAEVFFDEALKQSRLDRERQNKKR